MSAIARVRDETKREKNARVSKLKNSHKRKKPKSIPANSSAKILFWKPNEESTREQISPLSRAFVQTRSPQEARAHRARAPWFEKKKKKKKKGNNIKQNTVPRKNTQFRTYQSQLHLPVEKKQPKPVEKREERVCDHIFFSLSLALFRVCVCVCFNLLCAVLVCVCVRARAACTEISAMSKKKGSTLTVFDIFDI